METPPESNNFDRLSDLPDSIFHHILSFLDINEVARVSTLSRRCRNVCLSSPVLTIVLEVCDDKEFYRFSTFLHRFMSLRNGVGMRQFKVMCWQNPDIEEVEFHIGNWVLEATRCNVEKIYLHLNYSEMFTLPSGVLNCASLRHLEVLMGTGPDSLLKLPTTSFGGLESLTLRRTSVSIELFGEWISSCKSLKMLYLDYVFGIYELNISSSSLEKLILEDLMVSYDDHDSFNIKVSAERLSYLRIEYWMVKPQIYSLTLHAPKLEQFSWHGIVSHYSYEGSFESLSYSNISILPCPSSYDEHGALANGIFGKVLETIDQVSSLCIRDHCIEVIYVHQLQPKFCNLRSLTLIRTDMGDRILPRVFLLISMLQLDTLKIHQLDISEDSPSSQVEEEEEICYTAEYWESQNLEFVYSLKEVEMDIRGEENELELIKYLLKNAESLKKMIILYPSVLRRQSVISRKIQQFQIASSSIALYFLQK